MKTTFLHPLPTASVFWCSVRGEGCIHSGFCCDDGDELVWKFFSCPSSSINWRKNIHQYCSSYEICKNRVLPLLPVVAEDGGVTGVWPLRMGRKKTKAIPFLRPAAMKFTLQNFLLLLLCGKVLTDPQILWGPENKMPDPNDVTPIGEFIPAREDSNGGGESLEIRDGQVTSAAGFFLASTPPSLSSASSSSTIPVNLNLTESQETDDDDVEGSGEESLSSFAELLTTSIPPYRNNSRARISFPDVPEETSTTERILPEVPEMTTTSINESTSKAPPQQGDVTELYDFTPSPVALNTTSEVTDQPRGNSTMDETLTDHVTIPTIPSFPLGRADTNDSTAVTSSIDQHQTAIYSTWLTSSTSLTESAIPPVVLNSTLSSVSSPTDFEATSTLEARFDGTTEVSVTAKSCDSSLCGQNRQCYRTLDWAGPSASPDQREAQRACNCKEGYVLDASTGTQLELSRRCYCPLSKVLNAGECREANKVFQLEVDLYMEPVDPTTSQFSGTDSAETQRFLEALSQQFEQQEALSSLLYKYNISTSISPQIIPPGRNKTRRKRAETSNLNTLHAEFLVKFLSPNSSAPLPTQDDVVEALSTLDAELSSGNFVNSFLASKYRNVTVLFSSSTIEPFDYCEQQEHSCDVRSTECLFHEASARILCSCLPFHTPVSPLECVFDIRLSDEYLLRAERDKFRLWIALYVFIGLFAIFFILSVASLLFLKARPTRKAKSPKLTRNGRLDSSVVEYEYRLPRPRLLPAFARNSTQIIDEGDGRNSYLSAAPVISPYSDTKRVSTMNGTPQPLFSEPRRIGSTIVYNTPMYEMVSLNSFSRHKPAAPHSGHSTSSILMNDNNREESSQSPSVEMPRSIASFSEEVARTSSSRPISSSSLGSPSTQPLIDGGAIISIADHVAAREAAQIQRNSALADVLAQNNYVQSHV